VPLYGQLFTIQPRYLAHDLHPDYATTRYARDRAWREGIHLLEIQHHHAHLASCMAEHALSGSTIGVTFDGTGYGTDGTVWGGEFLIGDYLRFQRAAHLRGVGMPGGEQAIREPWRMAVAHAADAGVRCDALQARLLLPQIRTAERMLQRCFQTPLTSSAGRLFDAVGSLAALRDRVSYEGQAAVELEQLAATTKPDGTYPFVIEAERSAAAPQSTLCIDTRPLIEAVVAEVNAGAEAALIARRFHSTMVEIIAVVCGRLRAATQLDRVVLSGGVFLNALLTEEVSDRLQLEGFRVFRHRLVPPNDGGLSLGQLAVAAARLAAEGQLAS